MPGLTDEAKKVRGRVSACEATARAKVLRGGKLPATRSKQVKATVKAEAEQVGMQLCSRNARVAKLKARAIELEKQQKQSASQGRVAESKYSRLCVETQMLRQGLSTGFSCDEGMEQRFINVSKDVLGCMDALHSMAAKSQNTVRESFWGSFISCVQRLKAFSTLEIAAVFMSADDNGGEGLIELCKSSSACDAAAKGHLTDW